MAFYCIKNRTFARMKHIWIVLFALFFISCKEHDPEPEAPIMRKHVVVLYMIAENSLSSPFAAEDLNEIRQAITHIPDSCALVAYVDDSRTDQLPQIISFDKKAGEKIVFQYRNDPISADSATMQQALKIICNKFPAQHYGLVMWSHGSGWIPQTKAPQRTIGVDNGQNTSSNAGTEMEISTLANVLKNTGLHWDFVFFDACFMQGVEVAYELRDIADWCIGSPAEIPGRGAPYNSIMPDLFRESDEVWRIAETYYDNYRSKDGLIISALKTSELEALADATAPLLATLDEQPATSGIQKYLAYCNHAQWKPEYFDMGSAMGKWFTGEEYTTWREALERAVPHRFATEQWTTVFYSDFNPYITDPEHIACLSMYIPVEGHKWNDYYRQTAWWKRMRN